MNDSNPVSVVVLVQQYPLQPWTAIRSAQEETWMQDAILPVWNYEGRASKLTHGFNTFHERLRWSALLGKPTAAIDRLPHYAISRSRKLPEVRSRGGNLQVDYLDTYVTAGLKFLAALNWLLEEQQFDYVFRTNTSSYINCLALRQWANQMPKHGVYAGPIVEFDRFNFVSGSGILLSRDLVESLVADWRTWKHFYLEDVALGQFMLDQGVTPIRGVSCTVGSPDDVDKLSEHELLATHHFRCKSDYAGQRRDNFVMLALHRRFSRFSSATL